MFIHIIQSTILHTLYRKHYIYIYIYIYALSDKIMIYITHKYTHIDIYIYIILVGGLQHVFIFSYIGNHHPN